MKFKVVYTWDADYQGYVVEVPELPGCMSQGKTVEEAKANIIDAVQGVLQVLAARGEPFTPPPHPPIVSEIAV